MLIEKINCPRGCKNSMFTENTRIIDNGNSNLLLEGNQAPEKIKVKTYTCQCCGNSFEITESLGASGRVVL